MHEWAMSIGDERAYEQILGYLNFSSGAPDPRFLSSLDHIFELAAPVAPAPLWRSVLEGLERRLSHLSQHAAAFRDATQAAAVLRLVREVVLPGYVTFHQDLLFHQPDTALFNSLFVGRVCEAVLRQGGPWDDASRIASGAIQALNDYVGHRPVATLENRRIEPYAHEWVRPVPLWIAGAGVACGPYRQVVQQALRLLAETDEEILRAAYYDRDELEEIAFDPRAYDFDHPANKRPNYHFGQLDPHQINNRGFYTRYVVRQITLDALMSRLSSEPRLPQDQLVLEAAAVLAGTIIMSTGISGTGPDTHDSSVNLATLLPRIAAYRDTFYEHLLGRIGGAHGARLAREARQRHQPFGGARQHLNAALARWRAAQLEHVHLAAIFARMGFPEAAAAQADVVPAASARMLCQIDCRLTEGGLAVQQGDLELAARLLEEIMDWLQRGIGCGAIVDPWNILGFDGNFSVFPAMENSVRDHRVDELVVLMEQIFAFYSRVWSDAAARDEGAFCEQIAQRFRETAGWWRKYAAHEVSSVEAIDVDDAYNSAERVAHALRLWHQGGAATEDVGFWAPHASVFDSPKAYGLVIANLLERRDFVASMALLMHWLDQAEEIGLEKGDTSFFDLAEHWLVELQREWDSSPAPARPPAWNLACKFLDRLEANAADYWEVPSWELDVADLLDLDMDDLFALMEEEEREDEEEDEDHEELGLFSAAYEDVVYRDSTDDGLESELMDEGRPTDDELLAESKRLGERLAFLSLIARLWQGAITLPRPPSDAPGPARDEVLRHWIRRALENRRQLHRLLDQVSALRLPLPSGDHDSMVEYDRVRLIKETIQENVIATSVDMLDACRVLAALLSDGKAGQLDNVLEQELAEEERRSLPVLSAILRGQPEQVNRHWKGLVACLKKLPLLYVPITKGGNPHQLVAVKARQHMIQDLLAWLPRVGLVYETCQLVETAREMERQHAVGPGAVTEFDELFRIGYKALVQTIIQAARDSQADTSRPDRATDQAPPQGDETGIVDCLKQLTDALLTSWLAHSRTLRLSVLERLTRKEDWRQLVGFVESYGGDIFTQRFLNLANLRAILHHGLPAWLDQLLDSPPEDHDWKLLDDLMSGKLNKGAAERHLTLILEAIVENYGEYRDYNSMTTQSDRGELLYMLLDFLRLRTQYDRICWHLKPVVWAHELLVRQGHKRAAAMWRREFTDQTRQQADRLLERLAQLQEKYAMRMPTVADRLGERFVRPMAIDGMRALVKPAMDERHRGGPTPSFERLQHETDLLTREPSGVGLDVPAWLVALEEEVASVLHDETQWSQARQLEVVVPQKPLSLPEAQHQLERWSDRMRKR